MTKRMKIKFSGGENVFRITPADVSVDTATALDCLLHESALAGQVVQTGYLANPYPGTTMPTAPIIDLGYVPSVIFYGDFEDYSTPETDSFYCYPFMWVYGVGSPPTMRFGLQVEQTLITSWFSATGALRGLPRGIHYATLKQPR